MSLLRRFRNGPLWSRSVAGIVAATFLSDFGHEAATALLPQYLLAIGLGAGALGTVEGVADLVVSLTKLAGGIAGQRLQRRKPWAALAYAVTGLGTGLLGAATRVFSLTVLRSAAWVGRGFRGPLRDTLLAEAVLPSHFGRAYGLERAADMLGAVAGPLAAVLLLHFGLPLPRVLLFTLVPGLLAALVFMAVEEKPRAAEASPGNLAARARPAPLPGGYWRFLVGVLLFGLGDFSRLFLILLAARALGAGPADEPWTQSVPMLLFVGHNLVSAGAALVAGDLGDRLPKVRVLIGGYALGVLTNLVLAGGSGSLALLLVATALSGVYVAVEETLEKAAVAQWLDGGQRSLGLGVLACANAVGDMGSSVTVGLLLEAGRPEVAFLLAAAFGLLGVLWLVFQPLPRT